MEKHKEELLKALLTGKTMEEIAATFSAPLTVATLKQYAYVLYRIYGVRNRVELMAKLYGRVATPGDIIFKLKGSSNEH